MANYVATPMMSFGESVKTCFKKYVNFKGRARRSEYWWFALLNYILSIAIYGLTMWKMGVKATLEGQVGEAFLDAEKMKALEEQAASCDSIFFPCAAILGILMLIMLLPSLAVLTRRLHDKGKSGWMIWLMIIPIVNFVMGIVIFIWTILDGSQEPNKYGPSPKYVEE